ncbi:hypothetical protein [Rhizobium sp. RAF56]|uniref:hypothetical protein n=1 Tax=Rhizobium sp. RAF56 TaxID=3233062 RepID=UPI003F9D3603
MFFLGMTMGYLQPPVPMKRDQAKVATLPAEKDRRQIETTAPAPRTASADRPLIWAWRILC